MKKSIKIFFSLLTTVTMAFGVVAPTVSAQDTNWDEVLTQLNEVNQEVVSMEGDGTINVSADQFIDAALNFDFRYNVEEAFALELAGDVTGELVTTDAEGNPSTMPLDFAGQASIIDGIAYLFDGSSWIVEDVSAQEEQIAAEFDSMMAQIQEQADTMSNPELTQKYFDLSETDSEYVMTLKQDINPDEFWADIESHVDMEQIKQETIDQTIQQAEANGQEFTEEDRQTLEEQMDLSMEATKSVMFQLVDTMEFRYSKETYYLTHMLMDFSLDRANMEEIAADMGETTEGIPEDLNVAFSMEFNFANHGEVFDIVVPEGAPTFDEASSTEESATEGTESLEESTTEESVPAEETSEETTEVPAEESSEEETTEESSEAAE
ncbi:MAG: hypothetical protein ACTHYF_04470 [Ruoffia tabacinasalis]|uniref:hypothetical protein n=1 Tax=unclassified Ruoffia TaxID=2862149 RepID=UPI000EC96AB4|nr:hypothetical protein [Aerococcaceae bacterium]